MRETDERVPPEAAERHKNERNAAIAGFGLMGIGALIIGVPVIATSDIGLIPALAGVAVMLCGGLVRDPKTFKGIAEKAIDALPGGKH